MMIQTKMNERIEALTGCVKDLIDSKMNSSDHDMLQRLDAKVDSLKEDIKELKNGTSRRIDDLDAITKEHDKEITRIKSFGVFVVIAIGIAQFIIGKFF